MKPLVSILTPSIPERATLLEECKASVKAQTYRRREHLVQIDWEHRGCSWGMNQLAAKAKGDWFLPFADDDLLLPGAISTLLSRAGEGEIIWARPLVWGNSSPHLVDGLPPFIPSFALIRCDVWFELGGYQPEARREEDRRMWRKAVQMGMRFVLVEDAPTWIYRFRRNGDGRFLNKSYNAGRAS